MSSGSFKINVTNKLSTCKSYILALINSPGWYDIKLNNVIEVGDLSRGWHEGF